MSKKTKTLVGKKIYLVDTNEWAKITKVTEDGRPEEVITKEGKILNVLRRAYAIANTLVQVIEALFSGIRLINGQNQQLRQMMVSYEIEAEQKKAQEDAS